MARTKLTARRSQPIKNTQDEATGPLEMNTKSTSKADAEKTGEKDQQEPKRGMKRSSPSEPRDNSQEVERCAKKARLGHSSPEISSLRTDVYYRVDAIVTSILGVFRNNDENPRHIHRYLEYAIRDSNHALNVCIDNILDDLAEHSGDADDAHYAPPPPKINKMPASPVYSARSPEHNEEPGSPMYNPRSPDF